MSVPTPAIRHHTGSPPPAARVPDPLGIDPGGDDDIWSLPLPLRRPGPQPSNAGITLGYQHLAFPEKPVTTSQLGRDLDCVRQELEAGIRKTAQMFEEWQGRQESAIAELDEEIVETVQRFKDRHKAQEAAVAALRDVVARHGTLIEQLNPRNADPDRRRTREGGRR